MKQSKCKTCGLTGEARTYLDSGIDQNKSYVELSRGLKDHYDISIADTNIRKHYINHTTNAVTIKEGASKILNSGVTIPKGPTGWTPGFTLEPDGSGVVTTVATEEALATTDPKLIKNMDGLLREAGIDQKDLMLLDQLELTAGPSTIVTKTPERCLLRSSMRTRSPYRRRSL
jgi:hypothetical protein